MTSADWPARVEAATVRALEPAADRDRAGAMAAYLRGQFPFLGVAGSVRGPLQRAAWAELPLPAGDELPELLADAVGRLWARPQREYRYAACDLLGRGIGTASRAARAPAGFLLGTVRPVLLTDPWWDTVDALRGAAVGPLVQAHPELVAVVRDWVRDDDRWLVRSALIHQLGYGERTDEELLLELCAARAADREFFVAKAVGWALRTHARRRPQAVLRFCAEHPELTPLARREALKRLPRCNKPG